MSEAFKGALTLGCITAIVVASTLWATRTNDDIREIGKRIEAKPLVCPDGLVRHGTNGCIRDDLIEPPALACTEGFTGSIVDGVYACRTDPIVTVDYNRGHITVRDKAGKILASLTVPNCDVVPDGPVSPAYSSPHGRTTQTP